MNNDITINIKANTSEFEAAMARATEAAANFRKALKSLPWYFRVIMAVQALLGRLHSAKKPSDWWPIPPGAEWLRRWHIGGTPQPLVKWSTRYFHVGANADETGNMDSRPDPRKRPYIPCHRAKE